jgi:hypothetical protein
MGTSMPPIPGTTWVPPNGTQLTQAATPTVSGGIPQAIAAYPTMQQFQVSPQVSSHALRNYKLSLKG